MITALKELVGGLFLMKVGEVFLVSYGLGNASMDDGIVVSFNEGVSTPVLRRRQVLVVLVRYQKNGTSPLTALRALRIRPQPTPGPRDDIRVSPRTRVRLGCQGYVGHHLRWLSSTMSVSSKKVFAEKP